MLRTVRTAFPLLFIVLAHLFFLTQGAGDPKGNASLFSWLRDSRAGQPTVTLLQALGGATTYVLRVIDALGHSDEDTTAVAAIDTTAPQLSLAVSPTLLWPPNHKLVPVTVTVAAADGYDPRPTLRLASITSNEGELANDSGHTSPDIQDAQFGTNDREFLLRAARRAFGPGRIYTITYEAEDANGNLTTRQVTIAVP
jgi:hypothetical protein